MPENAYNGEEVDSFLDDYYYRIQVNPATINLGSVLSPVQETFILWNAWFVSKDCTDIVKTNPGEFTLTGLTAPFALAGLGWTTYTIDVPLEGSLEFTSTITFDFTTEEPVVTLTGVRVQIFPFVPLSPMQESLEWLTEILTAKDGSEQRIALRPAPRQGFVMRFFFNTEEDQARFDAFLFNWQKKTWGLPVWSEGVSHSATIAAGASTIVVDTSEGDFREDGLALIWQSPTSYEAVRIDTIDSSGLNLSDTVKATWTGEKEIIPLRLANMVTHSQKRAHPDGDAIVECVFLVRDNIVLTGYTPPVTHDSIEVLGASYVESTEDEVSDGDVRLADYGLGQFDFFSDSEFIKIDKTHVFKKFAKADCWDFRLFLHSLLGMRDVVWIPSFKADLTQTAQIGGADTSFPVVNVGLTDNAVTDMRDHLAFVFPDGTTLYREITGVTESGDEEIVSIDSALGLIVNIGDCEISFLDKYRLSSDKVEMDWENRQELECGASFVRVTE
jgi:hypothetical protein